MATVKEACLRPLVLAVAGGLVLTGGALALLAASDELFALDRAAMLALHSLTAPWLSAAMRAITVSASAPVAAAVTLAIAGWWWRSRLRLEAALLLITMAGSAAFGQGLKALLARPRPDLFAWLTTATSWSFPSGHTLTAVVLGGLVAGLVGRRRRGWRRVALWAAAAVWTALVGLSRIYLGVHYPSDVVASVVIGGLWLLGASCAYRAIAARS